MAEYNEIGAGRFNRLLQKLLQIKADPPVRVLGMELLPIIVLESAAPEWEYLKGGRWLGAGIDVAAVALQNSLVRLRNPLASGVLARVSLLISVGTASNIEVYRGAAMTDLASAGNEISRDSRGADAASLIVSSTTNVGASGNIISEALLAANTPLPLKDVAVLAPGSHVDISTDANVRLVVTLDWLERGREESEA